jgi:hypothetical protein
MLTHFNNHVQELLLLHCFIPRTGSPRICRRLYQRDGFHPQTASTTYANELQLNTSRSHSSTAYANALQESHPGVNSSKLFFRRTGIPRICCHFINVMVSTLKRPRQRPPICSVPAKFNLLDNTSTTISAPPMSHPYPNRTLTPPLPIKVIFLTHKKVNDVLADRPINGQVLQSVQLLLRTRCLYVYADKITMCMLLCA